MSYLEVLVRCTVIAALLGGLHWWARSLGHPNKKRAEEYEPGSSFFKGGRL